MAEMPAHFMKAASVIIAQEATTTKGPVIANAIG
jgi:hypothetical protein